MNYKRAERIMKRFTRQFYRRHCGERLEFLIAMAQHHPTDANLRDLVRFGYTIGKKEGVTDGTNKGLQWAVDTLSSDPRQHWKNGCEELQ